MGSYENIVKIEEIRKRADEGDYLAAQKILDTMDLKKVKNMADLNLMADVYSKNSRYDEAMDVLLKISQKTKTRKIIFELVETCILKNNVLEAEKYLLEYEKVAPKDFYKYIFRYKIDKLKKEPFEKLIETLEILKETEYIEQWAYELAKLYYKAGMEKECVQECSDIVLWFGDGVYVEKAKMLKEYYLGGNDKDKMLEELKRRAAQGINSSGQELKEDGKEEYSEEEAGPEEAVFTNEYDMEDDSVDRLADDLKKDIENILTQEQSDEEDPEEGFNNRWEEDDTPEAYITEDEAPSDIFPDNEEIPEAVSNTVEYSGEDTYDDNEQSAEDNNQISGVEEPYFDLLEEKPVSQEQEDTVFEFIPDEDIDEDDEKIKEMSENFGVGLEEIFGNFLHVKAVKKQLVKSIESITDEHTKSIQMIITGTAKSGKTTLGKDLTIFFNKTGKLKSTKVAKIQADKMNGVDVMSKKGTLKDCCLIIENASELKKSTIDKLLELIRYYHGDIIVILEENKININKLFREYPKLMDLFKNRIHLPAYTPEDLLGFAQACLMQREYRLSSKAHSVLMSKIYKMAKTAEAERQLIMIQELTTSVITSAEARIGRQIKGMTETDRLKDTEYPLILPEDFEPTS